MAAEPRVDAPLPVAAMVERQADQVAEIVARVVVASEPIIRADERQRVLAEVAALPPEERERLFASPAEVRECGPCTRWDHSACSGSWCECCGAGWGRSNEQAGTT